MDKIFREAGSKWMQGGGPYADIVLTSRIRLARNLDGFTFPHMQNDEHLTAVVEQVEETVKHFPPELGKYEFIRLSRIPPVDRMVLVEKHLISLQLAEGGKARAAAIREDEAISIMVNEEDHLRIQSLLPGLQLESAWWEATKVDDALEQRLAFSFDEKKGYLTACPTNVGTGMRASVMLHLPALVLTNQIGRILSAIGQLGLVVRGLYGEGTEATGNVFQISNQITLGQKEEEIVSNLQGVTRQIIEQERAARDLLIKESRDQLVDRVNRAYGVLSHAYIMSTQEALKLLSDVRLGADLQLIPQLDVRTLNVLMTSIHPGFLQKLAGQELSPHDRDLKRAAVLRDKLGHNE